MKATFSSTVSIPLKLLSREALADLRLQLTLKKRQSRRFTFGMKTSAVEQVFFYQSDDDAIRIPRRFGLAYAESKGISLEDHRAEGNKIRIEFNESAQSARMDLKPKQDRAVASVVDGLLANRSNSGILQAGTGAGKTVMGVKILCEIGRRTLVIVHNESLMDQWLWHLTGFPDGRPGFTNLKKSDIGYIWQKQQDVAGKKVVLCMIQTLIRREFSHKEKKAFGLVVFDEVQHLPAEAFSQALLKFDSKCLLGLSATPTRFDGMDILLSHGLGDVLNQETIGPQLLPDVYVIKHYTRIHSSLYTMYIRGGPYGGKQQVNLARLVNAVADLEERNGYIVDLTVRAADKDRKVMVFSDRIAHLERMKHAFASKTGGKYSSSMFVGGMTPVERATAKKSQVLWCTFQYAAEGIDLPDRDCLILTTPKSFVRQVVGRILRSVDGKKHPMVLDILDCGVPPLESMCGSRVKDYKNMGALVHLPGEKRESEEATA